MLPPLDPTGVQTEGRLAPGSARRLCLGGSFNPIHFGHLRCAKAAAENGGFDTVVLIPTAQSPHKPAGPELAQADQRLAMTRLGAEFMNTPDPNTPGPNTQVPPAAQNSPVRFETDDLELRRGGRSYTIDTARELRRRGWPQVWWLIGADMLNYLPKWHEADKLLDEVHFLVMARPGFELQWDALPPKFRQLRENVVQVPAIDISATDLRHRIREGQSIEGFIPPPVIQYIREHHLYR